MEKIHLCTNDGKPIIGHAEYEEAVLKVNEMIGEIKHLWINLIDLQKEMVKTKDWINEHEKYVVPLEKAWKEALEQTVKQAKESMNGKITDTINKLLRLEHEIGLLGRRSGRELLFALSSKAYQQLNEESNAKRQGERPCEIRTFIGLHGDARILEDDQQTDDVKAYYRSG